MARSGPNPHDITARSRVTSSRETSAPHVNTKVGAVIAAHIDGPQRSFGKVAPIPAHFVPGAQFSDKLTEEDVSGRVKPSGSE